VQYVKKVDEDYAQNLGNGDDGFYPPAMGASKGAGEHAG
jgi:hypothetical protein